MQELKADLTKQQEIDWFMEVAASVPDGTYISGLFTEAMTTWVSNRIGNDVFPDLYARLESTRENARQHLSHAKALEEKLAEAEQALLKEGQKVERFKELLANEERQRAKLRHRFQEHNEKWGETMDALNEAEDEIIRLKAKLYDLMV